MNVQPSQPEDQQDVLLRLVVERLNALRQSMLELAEAGAPRIVETATPFKGSARNLLHYLALRKRDLRALQDALAQLGLSSLGRCESHALASVEHARSLALRALGEPPSAQLADALTFAAGNGWLEEHATHVLGPAPLERATRIMVTMPGEAAEDYVLVRDLIAAGMNCARINCAHDDPQVWEKIVRNIRCAEAETSRQCRILMDLAGPKLRTASLLLTPPVLKVKPVRDEYGRVTRPARLWLTSADSPSTAPGHIDATLQVSQDWLTQLSAGERVRLTDARGAKREWLVATTSSSGCVVETRKTTYVIPHLALLRIDANGEAGPTTQLDELPAAETALLLRTGDQLILRRDDRVGARAICNDNGEVVTPPMVGCTLPQLFADIQVGEPVWFDDGRIGGVIERIDELGAHVRITYTATPIAKLRADKGINLPQSKLTVSALTAKDLTDLHFAARHADMIGFSFVSRPEDVRELQARLAAVAERAPAIILKIETQRGFHNLPDLLLAAMRHERCGVMIARGDLAIECGFERLAEVQEELLWLCEAAHVPVIWATSVLDTLARSGQPTRAEISDAAMGHRAECVMLNKGPHIREAVATLHDIMSRMQAHQSKKTSRLRALRLACDFRP